MILTHLKAAPSLTVRGLLLLLLKGHNKMLDAINDLTNAEAAEEVSILALQGRITILEDAKNAATVANATLLEQVGTLKALLANDPGNQAAIESIVDRIHGSAQRLDETLATPPLATPPPPSVV